MKMGLISWIADVVFLLPGFPGIYSRFQIGLLMIYMLMLMNTFIMFTLSLYHQYAQYGLSIERWMILSIIGFTLSNASSAMYLALFNHNKKRQLNDPRTMFLAVDSLRLVLSAIASVLYQALLISILFIYIYTNKDIDYRNRLDRGFNTYDSLDFTQRRLDNFLNWCQINFMFHVLPITIELFIHNNKARIKQWQLEQPKMSKF